jgi:glycosyltransferase involved in cell wall biosynthesis
VSEKSNAPWLTIAIPFYAGKDYLRRAIESVRSQSDPCWGLLVCDDASPENNIDRLVRSYGDERLRYHRNRANLGMAANWNRCLDLAETELVVLLHADDELRSNYCALMRSAALDYPGAVGFFCGTTIIDEFGAERFSFPDAFKKVLIPKSSGDLVLRGRRALSSLLRGNYIFCPTVCYRKSLLGRKRFRTSWRQVQDLDLFAHLLLDGHTLVGLREAAYAYRRHGSNATTQHTANLLRFDEERRLYDGLERIARLRRWRSTAAVARKKTIVKLNLAYCSLVDGCQGNWGMAAQKIAFLWQMISGELDLPRRRPRQLPRNV